MRPVWLDNAATSWPKPPEVLEAMRHWFEQLGVDASRGSSQRHETVATRVGELRQRLAAMAGVPHRHVVLCAGATDALNLLFKGFLTAGDRVWTTMLEHNAVVRPLIGLQERIGVAVRFIPPAAGKLTVDAATLQRELELGPPPKLFVYSHASNVTGTVQNFSGSMPQLRAAGVVVVVDCAQTAGLLPLDTLDADAIVLPGHKSLLGPPGVGALCLRRDLRLVAWREGGTGSSVATDRMPDELPAALESGTPNTPGLLGWLAGIEWVLQRGPHALHAREMRLASRLRNTLAPLAASGALRLFGAETGTPHVAVLSVAFRDLDPVEAAIILEQKGILARAGFHCAPYIHRYLGCNALGTLRLSPGVFSTDEDVDRAATIISELAS